MVTLGNLRRVYGHVVERATLARDLLAPAAGQLSGDGDGDPAGLHRRCILASNLDLFPERDDEVRADLERFGPVEAIALCRHRGMAVIVFRDEASVPIAYWRQEEASQGVYCAVPPPHLALSTCFIHPSRIKVNLYPSTAEDWVLVSAAEGSTEPTRREPSTGIEAATQATPLWLESRPAIVYENFLGNAPGTTTFYPSRKSQIYGPRLGADGHLWMDGTYFTVVGNGADIKRASIRVVQVPQLLYLESDLAAGRT